MATGLIYITTTGSNIHACIKAAAVYFDDEMDPKVDLRKGRAL